MSNDIYPTDFFFGGPIEDEYGFRRLHGGPGEDRFVMQRDDLFDKVIGFELGKDRLDFTRFDVKYDSLSIRVVSAVELAIFVRDEKTRVVLAEPLPDSILALPDRGAQALGAEEFVFRNGLPDAPEQTILDEEGPNALRGTSLPDIFVLDPDGARDRVYRFEFDKDRIDLSGFATSFGELEFIDRKQGVVVIALRGDGRVTNSPKPGVEVPGDPDGTVEKIAIRDIEKFATSADYTADDFIF